MAQTHHHIQTVGFFRRTGALVLDMMIISFVSSLIAITFFGSEYLTQPHTIESIQNIQWQQLVLEQGLPALWVIGFWILWMATPGKLLMDIQIVDSRSRNKPRPHQFILRYLGYILSIIPFGLGFLWVFIDKKHQGWHDKIANTMVIMQDDSLNTLESYK